MHEQRAQHMSSTARAAQAAAFKQRQRTHLSGTSPKWKRSSMLEDGIAYGNQTRQKRPGPPVKLTCDQHAQRHTAAHACGSCDASMLHASVLQRSRRARRHQQQGSQPAWQAHVNRVPRRQHRPEGVEAALAEAVAEAAALVHGIGDKVNEAAAWQAKGHRVKHARLPVFVARLQHKELRVAEDACVGGVAVPRGWLVGWLVVGLVVGVAVMGVSAAAARCEWR